MTLIKKSAHNCRFAIGCFSSPLDSFEERYVHFSEQTFVVKIPKFPKPETVNFNCND
jgi:hypothetical protein